MIGGSGAVSAGWPSGQSPVISVAGVRLDPSTRSVLTEPDGDDVTLTPLQTAILAYLMNRVGEVCTRDELMRDALGYANAVGSRTIDVHVASLRSKLGGALEIRAVRGVGYALEEPGSTEVSAPDPR